MEANLCLIVDHDSSDSEVSSYGENDYDALYDAFQQLLFKSSKLDVAHKKLKFDFKELQSKFEKSLEEEEILKNKISILENKKAENVECASCKSYMFDINILEKQLEDAINNKSFEKPMFRRKVFHKNKQAPTNKKKRTCRVWVEKGTTHSWNINCFTCFYCMQKGHTSNKCRIKHFDVPNERCAWIPIIK